MSELPRPERRAYPSDLNDEEWALIEPLLPPASVRGRPRANLREVVNAIVYVAKTGVQWGYLPHDFPPKSTVFEWFGPWRDDGTWRAICARLTGELREHEGREATPSLAIVDAQSVATTGAAEEVGYDGHKKVKGRKRSYLVDILGLVLAVVVTSAQPHDSQMLAPLLHRALDDHGGLERLEVVLGDSAYQAQDDVVEELAQGVTLEIVQRPPGQKGFAVQPKRWIVERSFAWAHAHRRLVCDHERTIASAEAFCYIAHARLALRRLTQHANA